MLIGDEFPGARHREDPLWTRSSNQKWWGTTSSPSIYLIRATSPLELLLNYISPIFSLSLCLYFLFLDCSHFLILTVIPSPSVYLVRFLFSAFVFCKSPCSRLPAKMSTSIINIQRDSTWRPLVLNFRYSLHWT